MVTTITKSVGATARDYSTIQIAADAVGTIMNDNFAGEKDMTVADAIIRFELYDDADFAEAVDIDIPASVVTGVDNYVIYVAASGEGHSAVRNGGVKVAPSSDHAFTITMHHTHFDRLQVVTGSGPSDECFHINTGLLGVTVENCILEPNATQTGHDGVYAGNYNVGSATYPILVRNCLIHGFDRAGVHAQQYSASSGKTHYWQVVNCTLVDNDYGIGWRSDKSPDVTYIEVINCIGGGNSTADLGNSASGDTGSLDTTGSSDNFGEDTVGGTDAFPDNTAITLTDSTAGGGVDCIVEDFTGADYTLWDLRMVDHANNDAQDAGVGPSIETLVALYDAVGNTRTGSTTDPGYYQITTYGAPPTRRVFVIS